MSDEGEQPQNENDNGVDGEDTEEPAIPAALANALFGVPVDLKTNDE